MAESKHAWLRTMPTISERTHQFFQLGFEPTADQARQINVEVYAAAAEIRRFKEARLVDRPVVVENP